MKKAVNTKKGFSIGEVLIAMFILLVGIVDAVFLTVRSIDDLGDSRDSIVATLLAQEGTELVRNVRDNNVTEPGVPPATNDCTGNRCTAFEMHSGYAFPSETNGATSDGAVCRADYRLGGGVGGGGALQCTGNVDPVLYFNESAELYAHDSGDNIKRGYERQIYIKYGPSSGRTSENIYADVTSIVIFGKGNWSDIEPSDPQHTCLKSKNCAYAQTRLTSWINYGG